MAARFKEGLTVNVDLLEHESVEMPVLRGKDLEGGHDAADLEQRTLAALIENSKDFIGVASLEGQARFVNPAGRTLVGLESDEQVRASRMSDYVIEEDRHRFLQEALPAVVREGRWDGEMRFRHFQTGAPIPMLQQIFLIRDEGSKQPVAFATISRDVTQRTGAETALRRSEARFRSMVEGVRDYAICMLDPEGRVVLWNSGAERLEGYSEQEILDQHFSRLYEPSDIALGKPDQALREAATKGRVELEGWRVRKDGTRYWANVVITALKDDRGKLEAFAKVTRDMTERKQAVEALRASEERFRSYFELGLIGMASTSSAKGFLEVNDELCGILGYTRDELLHKSWAEMTHPDDLATDVAQFNRVLAGETDGYTLDKRFIRKDGRLIDTIMAARCLRRADRSPDHFVALVLDTTERKRAEAAVQKLQRELAHVSRVTLMGELASSIAHEINQPLGAIVNNSKVCLRVTHTAPGLPQDVREALADIAEDANRTSAIIARIRALINRSTPEATSLRLTDVVAEVLLLAHRELVERHITVRTDLSDALPKVCGDRVQLQQVLLNLVMNGCDAMSELPEARRLLLLAGHRNSLAGQPAVLITVRDFGHGFKPEDTERLFEAFYSTRPHGMGMGLSISRFIVEAHGGQLRASLNSDGPGATFLVLLPAPDQNPTPSHP